LYSAAHLGLVELLQHLKVEVAHVLAHDLGEEQRWRL
jgi:hypothetical protein